MLLTRIIQNSRTYCIVNTYRTVLHFNKSIHTTIMSPKRGALIVLEGADSVGKSSHAKKIVEDLKEKKIQSEFLRFPDYNSKIGVVIKEYLKQPSNKLHDKAVHMLFSANRWEKYEEIIEKLESGVSLVIDRYSHSGIVYSASKGVEGMDIEWCKTQEIGLPKPDLVCLLQVDLETLIKRPKFGKDRYENKEMQIEVIKHYEQLKEANWEIVDTTGEFDAVHEHMLNKILPIIKEVENKEIEYFKF